MFATVVAAVRDNKYIWKIRFILELAFELVFREHA